MTKRIAGTAALAVLALALPAGAAQATYPGANGEIAVNRYLDESDTLHLRAVDPASGAIRDLTSPDSFDLDPSWTADGGQAVFRCNDWIDSDICTANPDGSGYRELGFDETHQNHSNPSLSPDGKRMLYEGQEGGGRGVYVANPDGTGVRRLVGGGEPVWSPDGRRIVFDRLSGATTDIYQMNRDGSGLKRLTHNPANDRDPDVAPDGRSIVFVSERSGNPEIHVTNAAGTQTRKLTGDPAVDTEPVFSPDGRRIAWERQGPTAGIHVMNADASNKGRLTDGGRPAWRPLAR